MVHRLQKNCWNSPSATARNVAVVFELRLPNRRALPDPEAVNCGLRGAFAVAIFGK